MKKLLFLVMLTFSIGMATHAQDNKEKVKKTSTVPQKVHNTFSKHKKHSGYRTKQKHNGVKHKHIVNTKEGEVRDKTKK